MKFQQIESEAAKLNHMRGVGYRVNDILDRVRCNSDDRAIATLKEILSDNKDPAINDWFNHIGFS